MTGSRCAGARRVLVGLLMLAGVAAVTWWLLRKPPEELADEVAARDSPASAPVLPAPLAGAPDPPRFDEEPIGAVAAPDRLAPQADQGETILLLHIVTVLELPARGAAVMMEPVSPPEVGGLGSPHPRNRVTDNDGSVRVEPIEPGAWSITVILPGHAPAVQRADVPAGGLTEVRIALSRPAVLAGTVRDALGRPLAAVDVSVGQPGTPLGAEDWSNVHGRFQLEDLSPGPTEVVADDTSGVRVSTTLDLVAGSTTTWDPVLPAGNTLEGLLVDALGAPSADRKLMADEPDGLVVRDRIVTTDTEGRFVFTNLEGGGQDVYFVPQVDRMVLLTKGVALGTTDLVLQLPPEADLAARLVADLVAPPGDVLGPLQVIIVEPATDRRWFAQVTWRDGRLESPELPAGRHELHVQSAVHAAAVFGPFELQGGAPFDAGQLQLVRGGWIRVRVADPWLRIRCTDAEGRVAVDLPTGESERTSFPLAPGEWIVRAGSSEVLFEEVRATVRAGEVTDVPIELEPGVIQHIELELPTNDPAILTDVCLRLRDDQGRLAWDSRKSSDQPALHDEPGRAPRVEWLVNLRPGRYALETEAAGRRWQVDGLQTDERDAWIIDGN